MGGRCAVAMALAVWGGLVLGGGLQIPAALAALTAAASFAALALRAPDRTGTVALLAALALAGAARGAGHRALLSCQRAAIGADGTPWRIEGRLAGPPPRESGEPTGVLVVERARPPLAAGTRVRLRLPEGSTVEWGDRVQALARLELPPGARNPGGFDARAAADAAALAATGRAFTAIALPGGGAGAWPGLTVARWRRALERRLDAGLSPEARELVVPLVLGDRSGLSSDLNADLRAAGLIHLLALSGLHVMWLAAVARGLAAALGGGVRARALAGALCAALYAGIAGPLPSLMRAATGETLGAIARLRGCALDPVQALAVSALVLLTVAPGWADDLGFQLSCAATLGLATVGPWLDGCAGRARRWLAPFIPTASAQLTALPLLLARFHAVSWVGALSNLLAVPVAGLLLVAAWLAAVSEIALPGAGRLWAGACEVLAALLRAIATGAARLPGAMVSAGAEPGVLACAWTGAALLALALPGPRTLDARDRAPPAPRVAAALAGALALAVALACVATARPLRPPQGRAWLVALDVGQGDALALGFDDAWWLVDAGPRTPGFDAGQTLVAPFLRWAGVRRLGWLLLTHDDGDHVGGAGAVCRAVSVERIGAPPEHPRAPGPGERFGAVALARGDTLRGSPPAVILWPPPRDEPAAPPAGRPLTSADNAAGLVLQVGEAGGRALFLADVDSTVEESLAVAPGVLILKVAHHGSASSSGARFLARVRPALALLSVGARNHFGHPSPVVLGRLAAAGTQVRRTDREGALWLEWSREGVQLLEWRAGEPCRSRSVRSRAADGARAPARR
ncbi:MAG: DNA internalization-related competence protein ComEC/Rec2 [Candidatus Eisenbacteria bacterium]|nr:DNA internalization-related competence protein ComEC/Rec2 [Candidatus Eisenbacteria bacterium]